MNKRLLLDVFFLVAIITLSITVFKLISHVQSIEELQDRQASLNGQFITQFENQQGALQSIYTILNK